MATILSPHTISPGTEPPAPAPTATPKALWITVGVLAVVASALGGALVMKSADQTARAGSVQQAAAVPQASTLPKIAPADGTPINDRPMELPLQAQPDPEQHAHAAAHGRKPAPVKRPAPHPTQAMAPQQVAQAPAPMPVQAPRAVCGTCGTVQSVQPVSVKGNGSGLGVAGGAVAGGLLGHQMGGGSGKTALTVLGAIGGALAGNEVEKRARATTEYDVQVRMEDGSYRTVRQSQPVSAGTRVNLSNGELRVAGN